MEKFNLFKNSIPDNVLVTGLVNCLSINGNKNFTVGKSFIVNNKTDVSVLVYQIYYALLELLEEYDIDIDLEDLVVMISYRKWVSIDDLKDVQNWSKLMKKFSPNPDNLVTYKNTNYNNDSATDMKSNIQPTIGEVALAANNSQIVKLPDPLINELQKQRRGGGTKKYNHLLNLANSKFNQLNWFDLYASLQFYKIEGIELIKQMLNNDVTFLHFPGLDWIIVKVNLVGVCVVNLFFLGLKI